MIKKILATSTLTLCFMFSTIPAITQTMKLMGKEVIQNAGFPARYDHASAVFNNKIWIIGGKAEGYKNNLLNDVWRFE